MRPVARLQARKTRKRIHRNTLRIFQVRGRRRWSWIIRRSRTVNVGQAPENFLEVDGGSMLKWHGPVLAMALYQSRNALVLGSA
jgi:hypothetical protein